MSDTNEKVRKEEEKKDGEMPEAEADAESKAELDEEEQQQDEKASARKEELREKYKEFDAEDLVEMLVERDLLISGLEKELQSARDGRLRKAAELENVKKRVQRDRAQMFENARAEALKDFLPINDDLRRTLKAFDEAEVNQNFMDGVSLVANKFEEVLNKYGVERIDEEGVPFDVDLHDAMMRQKPEDDSMGSDMVLQVLENGYRMGNRTIRHAKVIVSE